MAEFLKSINTWFLVLSVMILGGWFVWSVRNIFDNFTISLDKLNKLIEKLFDKHDGHESRLDDHERRISAQEGRCDVIHGSGRRSSDHQ